MDAAKAIGLCSGVTSAQWGLPDGSTAIPTGTPGANYALGHGLLTTLGNSETLPQEGARMLAVSSGYARGPGDPGYSATNKHDQGLNKGYQNSFPATFPRTEHAGATTCNQQNTAYDGVGLTLTVQAPAGATGYAFDFNYYSDDYPLWQCTVFTDDAAVFINGTDVLTDAQLHPMSVNNGFLEACVSYNAWTCPYGYSPITGTGFDTFTNEYPQHRQEGGATRWQTIFGSATGGQVYTIGISIWDSGDGSLDSLLLVDHFRWTYK
jgi:hypothetical protein